MISLQKTATWLGHIDIWHSQGKYLMVSDSHIPEMCLQVGNSEQIFFWEKCRKIKFENCVNLETYLFFNSNLLQYLHVLNPDLPCILASHLASNIHAALLCTHLATVQMYTYSVQITTNDGPVNIPVSSLVGRSWPLAGTISLQTQIRGNNCTPVDCTVHCTQNNQVCNGKMILAK